MAFTNNGSKENYRKKLGFWFEPNGSSWFCPICEINNTCYDCACIGCKTVHNGCVDYLVQKDLFKNIFNSCIDKGFNNPTYLIIRTVPTNSHYNFQNNITRTILFVNEFKKLINFKEFDLYDSRNNYEKIKNILNEKNHNLFIFIHDFPNFDSILFLFETFLNETDSDVYIVKPNIILNEIYTPKSSIFTNEDRINIMNNIEPIEGECILDYIEDENTKYYEK